MSSAGALSAEHEARPPLRSVAPCVDFLGLGVQKAGTSWLYRALAAHPDVFMAQGDDKDLRFFSAFYDFGYPWYERHFAAGAGTARRGEFSTSYFYSREAPERVHRYNRDIRLIVSLREPVARLISHHRHEIRLGHVSGDLSLERGIENNPSYVEQSLYSVQLCRWLEYFPPSSFHVLIFEELFAKPEKTVAELYRFIGVSPDFVPGGLGEKVNEGRIPRSRGLERVVRVATSGLRAVGAGRVIDSLKRAGADRAVRAGNSRSDDAMRIDPSLVER